MKNLFLIIFAGLSIASAFSSPALAASGTKREILSLVREIEDALLDSSASEKNLKLAKSHLQQALDSIQSADDVNDGPGPISTECTDFAYEKYFQSLSSERAMDKSAEACRKTDSLEVMEFLYDKFFMQQSAANAMDSAAEASRAPMEGKLDIVKFAYEKYFFSLSAGNAAQKAAETARKMEIGSLACLESAYEKYFQSQSASRAMDSAAAYCAN